jgi:hypothetical protein
MRLDMTGAAQIFVEGFVDFSIRNGCRLSISTTVVPTAMARKEVPVGAVRLIMSATDLISPDQHRAASSWAPSKLPALQSWTGASLLPSDGQLTLENIALTS